MIVTIEVSDIPGGTEPIIVWPIQPGESEAPDVDRLQVMIIFGIAGIGAGGGAAFFVFSRRALKKEEGAGQ